jgi:hypothetical protein
VHFISYGISSSLKVLLRVSKTRGLLHGIRAGSFDNDGPFSPVVEHVFGQRYHVKVRGRVKDFISHGHPSSLKASFESEYSPWTFTWYQIHRFVAMIGLFLPLLSTCLAISCHT